LLKETRKSIAATKAHARRIDYEYERIALHGSIGPVALAACLHFDVGTPGFMVQEALDITHILPIISQIGLTTIPLK